MHQRESWFIKIIDMSTPDMVGYGEAGPLPGLSLEFDDHFEQALVRFLELFNKGSIKLMDIGSASPEKIADTLCLKIQELRKYPSVLFALETALLDLLNGGTRTIFNNRFVEGAPIPINGLIWMAGMDMVLQQIEIKIQEGFDCLKLKVGGLDFERECDILQYIRRKYFKMNITLRLDANGAFKPADAMYKLHELSKYTIHSLEQPVKAGAPNLVDICRDSPIPIALDEELIGLHTIEEKRSLLESVRPQYIILKPSLHGGIAGCHQWIEIAKEMKVGWWITSALESSIGLNAIAQLAANYDNSLHQGLGTGKIYEDNFESPLEVKSGKLSYNKGKEWELPKF